MMDGKSDIYRIPIIKSTAFRLLQFGTVTEDKLIFHLSSKPDIFPQGFGDTIVTYQDEV